MRIIAGTWRGRRLTPLGKGDDQAHLRPTPDRVRESLFSMLSARNVLEDARVLDLFAGTGALGLEALSRGASYALHVENGRIGKKLIAQNHKLLDANAELHVCDAAALRKCHLQPFDLVFLDPPYGKGLGMRALSAALAGEWLQPGALVVWEENALQTAPDGFTYIDHRRFGDTHVTLLEVDAQP